ncbi:MAG TPA: BPSS1780 family membrane protein [Burkholderiales bacterium]|nr:BPSS1780 family membrane protein [Burkholderiales bacterium]
MMDLGGNLDANSVPAGNGWLWITHAWTLFLRQPGVWVLIFVLFTVIMVALSLLGTVGTLASALVIPILAGGFVLAARTADQGGVPEITMLFEGFREKAGPLAMLGVLNLAALLVIGLVVGLIMGVGMGMGALVGGMGGGGPGAMMGGMAGMSATALLGILVAFALYLPVAAALWFAPALVMFRGIAPLDAARESLAACLKNLVPLLVYGLAVMLLGTLASIAFGLGWLALGPVLGISVYTGYRDIFTG